MIQKLSQNIKERGANQLLLLFLITDVFFIILHILHKLPPVKTAIPILDGDPFSITSDLSLAEGFQYTKELWIALALILFSIKYREKAYIGWILLFFFLVFDDMFSIHENLGGLIGANFTLPDFLSSWENLRAKDFGELIAAGGFGVLFLSFIFIGFLRGSAETKKTIIQMLMLLIALVVFGVGVDFLDRFVNSRIIQDGVKIIEEGGEMIAMSVFCWYVLSLPEPGRAKKTIDIPNI